MVGEVGIPFPNNINGMRWLTGQNAALSPLGDFGVLANLALRRDRP